jgi:hypothetical protein
MPKLPNLTGKRGVCLGTGSLALARDDSYSS